MIAKDVDVLETRRQQLNIINDSQIIPGGSQKPLKDVFEQAKIQVDLCTELNKVKV